MGRRGFTLVEIMVVVVIIAMLATMATFKYMQVKDDADIKTTRTLLTKTVNDLNLYKLKHNRYPASIESMVPDYYDAVPTDAWGNPIDVVAGPRVVSRGPDGVAGTADDMKHPD